MSLENIELLSLKKNIIHSNTEDFTFSKSIHFSYHGIDLVLKTNSDNLIHCIKDFFPLSWLSHDNAKPQYEIIHIDPSHFHIDQADFENEESQDCHIDFENNCELAVQRDFVALKSDHHVKAIFNSNVDDGFFNFFRWLICRDLILNEKAILHSSCIMGHNNKAYVFLGPSGAGKTTTCVNAEGRKVLGDDMNILILKKDKIYMQAGSIGGRFESQIPFDQLVEVQGFYWLSQSQDLTVEALSASRSLQCLIASLANVFWNDKNSVFNQKALEFCQKVVSKTSFYKLSLQNSPMFWSLIEPKTISMNLNGNSMYPSLMDAQQVHVKTDYKLAKGGVYSYRDSSNKIVAHRLIDESTLIFKGDNSLCFEQISKDQIIGRVQTEKSTRIENVIATLSSYNSKNSSRIVRVLSRLLIRIFSY